MGLKYTKIAKNVFSTFDILSITSFKNECNDKKCILDIPPHRINRTIIRKVNGDSVILSETNNTPTR